MMKMSKIEKMSFKKQKEIQWQRLKKMLLIASQKSKFYKKWFKKHGINPQKIKNFQDYQKLPLMDKTQILENEPFSFSCVPFGKLSMVVGTGGTSGKSKLVLWSQKGWENVIDCYLRFYQYCGINKNDILYPDVTFGSMAGNGILIINSFTKLGGLLIPAGTGIGYDYVGELLKRCHATVIWTSPARAIPLTEELKKRGYHFKKDFKVRVIICSGMHLSDLVRKFLSIHWGAEIYEFAGAGEIGILGSECSQHNGMHIHPDNIYWEVINPETLKPIKEGEIGEAVVSTLTNDGMPLFRYRLNDFVKIVSKECKCGRKTPRLWILGRTSETIFLGAHKVYGYQIEEVLKKIPDLSGIYQLHIINEGASWVLNYKLETARPIRNKEIENLRQEAKEKLENLSITFQKGINEGRFIVKVEIVPPNTIPRTERGKIKDKIIDERKFIQKFSSI